MIAEVERAPPAHQARTKPNDALRRQLRSDFVQGLGTVKELAVQHGLSYHTVHTWLTRGNWQDLKDRREAAELAKLESGVLPREPLAPKGPSPIDTLTAHLVKIDSLLAEAKDGKDCNQLMQAREKCEKQLHFAKHGSWPGTTKPASNRRRQSASPVQPTFEPEG